MSFSAPPATGSRSVSPHRDASGRRAARRARRGVVCLDEFQDLLVADDGLDGLVRSVVQHHGSAATYVFAGSQPSFMRALFNDHERPFYGQARPLEAPFADAHR